MQPTAGECRCHSPSNTSAVVAQHLPGLAVDLEADPPGIVLVSTDRLELVETWRSIRPDLPSRSPDVLVADDLKDGETYVIARVGLGYYEMDSALTRVDRNGELVTFTIVATFECDRFYAAAEGTSYFLVEVADGPTDRHRYQVNHVDREIPCSNVDW
jgi:hypothetical protein